MKIGVENTAGLVDFREQIEFGPEENAETNMGESRFLIANHDPRMIREILTYGYSFWCVLYHCVTCVGLARRIKYKRLLVVMQLASKVTCRLNRIRIF